MKKFYYWLRKWECKLRGDETGVIYWEEKGRE